MKYFILQGLIPEPYEDAPHVGREVVIRQERIRRWRGMEAKLPREGEHVFLRQHRTGRLSVLVHDVYDALLMVSAPSQRKAYALALPFRAYLTVYLGFDVADGPYEFLLELKAMPKLTDTTRDIARLYQRLGYYSSDPDVLSSFMRSGVLLHQPQIRSACKFVKRILPVPQFVAALLQFERSHGIFASYMSNHHYQHHYRHERRLQSAYVREKNYLEERTRYDLAFYRHSEPWSHFSAPCRFISTRWGSGCVHWMTNSGHRFVRRGGRVTTRFFRQDERAGALTN